MSGSPHRYMFFEDGIDVRMLFWSLLLETCVSHIGADLKWCMSVLVRQSASLVRGFG